MTWDKILKSLAGISGNVDMNRITGDGHDLGWFLGGD